MVISADFEMQKQYFVKKNYCFVEISLYRNIAILLAKKLVSRVPKQDPEFNLIALTPIFVKVM